jgi:hypothetical protein
VRQHHLTVVPRARRRVEESRCGCTEQQKRLARPTLRIRSGCPRQSSSPGRAHAASASMDVAPACA